MAGSKILILKVPCNISVRGKTAALSLDKTAKKWFSDGADPVDFKCLRCGTEWDELPPSEWHTKTCSNCYSDRVVIVGVRVEFNNWGEQNGGEREQMERYESAKQLRARLAQAMQPVREEI